MTAPQANPLKKIAALMLIPFMLVVAGCGKLDATVTIESPEKITLEGVVSIKKSSLEEIGMTPSQFCGDEALEEFTGETKPDLKLEEKDDEVVCTFSGQKDEKNPMGDALKYDEESDTYTYKEASKGSFGDQAAAAGFKVDFTFVFPGKVTESSVGKIDGNKVHITDTKEYFSEINIKAEGSSFPWLIVIIVVVVVLLLVLAAVVIGALVFMKRKKKSGAGQADFSQQGFNQSPAQGPSSSRVSRATRRASRASTSSPRRAPRTRPSRRATRLPSRAATKHRSRDSSLLTRDSRRTRSATLAIRTPRTIPARPSVSSNPSAP